MNQLLLSVLLAAMLVLFGGAVMLLGLIAVAGHERAEDEVGLMQKILCRLPFYRGDCCEPAGSELTP